MNRMTEKLSDKIYMFKYEVLVEKLGIDLETNDKDIVIKSQARIIEELVNKLGQYEDFIEFDKLNKTNNIERQKFIDWLLHEKEKLEPVQAWKDCIMVLVCDLKFEIKKENEKDAKRSKTN